MKENVFQSSVKHLPYPAAW